MLRPRPIPEQVRDGFTLRELVVLVLRIVAAVAAPRFGDQAKTAKQNTARQSLQIARNAI